MSKTERRLKIATAVLAFAGLGISGYLTYEKYSGNQVACNILHGCQQVQESVYAELAGIPIPLLGLFGYVTILLSLFIRNEFGRLTTTTFSLIGFGFSLYLTYLEIFEIKALCQWCVGSAILMTAILVISLVRLFKEYE